MRHTMEYFFKDKNTSFRISRSLADNQTTLEHLIYRYHNLIITITELGVGNS